MKTLVLPPRYSDDSAAVSKAAARAEWAVERLASWHVPPLLREEDVRVYGEPLFVLHAAAELDLALIETPYAWLAQQPPEYVRRDVLNATLGEARAAAGRRAFVKPAMEKFFKAGVYGPDRPLPGPEAASDRVPVIVAEPVEWEAEFRCFVRDRACLTMSPYWVDGRLAMNDDGQWVADDALADAATEFVATLLADRRVTLPPAIVLDVGRIRGRGWAIVETNPAWGLGIYGCDPAAVLAVVERSCGPARALAADDRAWVIDHANEDFL
jgi:hypothetical protein